MKPEPVDDIIARWEERKKERAEKEVEESKTKPPKPKKPVWGERK